MTLDEALKENARLRELLRCAEQPAVELDGAESPAAAQDGTAQAALRRAALQRAILESFTDYALISTDLDGRITSWSAGAAEILGWTEQEMLGRPLAALFSPEEVAAGLPTRKLQLAAQAGREEDERFHLRKDGSRFWANAVTMPLLDGAGVRVGYVKVLRDRSRKHQDQLALEQSEASLRIERAKLEAVFQAAPIGLSITEGPNGRSVLVNAATRRITGRAYEGESLERYQDGGARHPDGQPYAVSDYPSVRALRIGEEVRGEAMLLTRPDGVDVRLEVSSSPVRDPDGEIIASVTALVDVEAREQAIEHQTLLMGELAHRMKNTLAMVQAIVSQTLRGAESLEIARLEVMERLSALSRAQDVLTRTSWTSANLADTVTAALKPLSLGPDRLHLEGPEVRLGARAALSFTLALHELATNAAKYGALSVPEGRVELSWCCEPRGDDDEVILIWSESGGPEVRAPARTGFGSRLIESLSRTFAGRSELAYEIAGVRWRLSASAKALRAF